MIKSIRKGDVNILLVFLFSQKGEIVYLVFILFNELK